MTDDQPQSVHKITQECRYCANTGWFYGDPDLQSFCGCQFGKVREEATTAIHPEMTVIDPSQWESCSPSYLERGGDCANAPRVWNAKECNHYHPKLPEV